MNTIMKKCGSAIFALIFIIMAIPKSYSMEEDNRLQMIIKGYKEDLPKIKRESDKSAATDITTFLADLIPSKSRANVKITGEGYLPGQIEVEKSISTLVENSKKITFFLYGFPFKSINTKKKGLGVDPDLGEVIALVTLQHICSEIKSRYQFGAECLIISDGLHTCEALERREEDVRSYVKNLNLIAQEIGGDIKLMHINEIEGMPTFNKKPSEIVEIVRDLAPYKGERDKERDGYSIFTKEELDCEYYQSLAKGTVENKTDCFKLIGENEGFENLSFDSQTRLRQLPILMSCIGERFDTEIKNSKSEENKKAFRKMKRLTQGKIEHNVNQELSTMKERIAKFLVEDTFCFSQFFAKYYPGYNEYFRISINLNGFTSMKGKIPTYLITGEGGTPWHMTPAYDLETKKVKLVKRNKVGKNAILREEEFAGQMIRWYEISKK